MRRLAALLACVLAAGASTAMGGAASARAPEATTKSKLLSLSNLPAGWTVNNTPVNRNGLSGSACLAGLTPGSKLGLTGAFVSFDVDGNPPLLGEELSTGKNIATQWRKVNARLATCKTLNFAGLGGTHNTGTIAPLPFPKVGSSSFAYAITVPISGVGVGIDLVLFRTGKYVCVVEYGGIGAPSSAVLLGFVNQALAKVTGKGSTTPLPNATPTTTTPVTLQ